MPASASIAFLIFSINSSSWASASRGLRFGDWLERLLIVLVESIVAVVENTVLTPQNDHKNADGEDEDDCGGKDGDHTVVALFHPV